MPACRSRAARCRAAAARAAARGGSSSSACASSPTRPHALATRRCAHGAAARMLAELAKRAERGFATAGTRPAMRCRCGRTARRDASDGAARSRRRERRGEAAATAGTDRRRRRRLHRGRELTLIYEGKKCIHARFCVTWGPKVFLANVKGPWINPDAMDVERARRDRARLPVRRDPLPAQGRPARRGGAAGEPDRRARSGPVRRPRRHPARRRARSATARRCAAAARRRTSRSATARTTKSNFAASGEPPTGKADMLPVRDGPLAIDPQTDGPLQVRGNLEITSGTGRVVARVTQRGCAAAAQATTSRSATAATRAWDFGRAERPQRT